jgi:hypothetical protein
MTDEPLGALRQLALIGIVLLVVAAGAGLSLAERFGLFSTDTSFSRLAPPPPDLLPENTTVSDPREWLPVTRDEAMARNAGIPVTRLPIDAAPPFGTTMMSGSDYARALDCLTAAIYYEAAIEPLEGQRAVAQVVLNRVRHPAFPHTVCGVVFQGATRRTGCQFSFACDGSLARLPSAVGWTRARMVAAGSLGGYVVGDVGLATHYHADYVLPYWSPKMLKLATIGRHIFLRWTGDWGVPRAFRNFYRGGELAIAWRGGFTPTDGTAATGAPVDPRLAGGAPTTAFGSDRPLLGFDRSAQPNGGGTASAQDGAAYVAPDQRFVFGVDGKRLVPDPAAPPHTPEPRPTPSPTPPAL